MKTVKEKNSKPAIAMAAFDGFIAGYASNDRQPYTAFVSHKPKTDMPNDKSAESITNSDLIHLFASTFSTLENHQSMRVIAENLCKEHPEIAADPEMLGGMPHIKGMRLSVGSILEKLYLYGSVEKIREIYKSDISEHQIKAAIAYAQDFLENACASR